MPDVRIPAFAKINLRLDILGKRTDGFHELRTIFQTISLHDDLRLRPSRSQEISLTVEGNQPLSAEPPEKNLVYRAVDALRRELKIRAGVRIELKKSIPAGRGLGGGSSDAAAALLGYLRLTKKRLPAARLLEIASSLGADVPFFLLGGRALGVNKGDEIYPLPDIPKLQILVVSPKGELLQRGAAEASLAGSGSAVFGVFPSPAMARRAAVGFPHDQAFVCESVSRDRYARLMRIAE